MRPVPHHSKLPLILNFDVNPREIKKLLLFSKSSHDPSLQVKISYPFLTQKAAVADLTEAINGADS